MEYTLKTLSDSAEDIALAQDLFHFYQVDDNIEKPTRASDHYLQRLFAAGGFHTIVALHDGKVIGGVTGYELPMYIEETKELFLYEIAVEPEYRKQGIGRALIEALKKLCLEKGIKVIFVGTWMTNVEAIGLYGSTGGKREDIPWFTYDL